MFYMKKGPDQPLTAPSVKFVITHTPCVIIKLNLGDKNLMKLLKVNKQSNLVNAVVAENVIITSVSKERKFKGANILDVSFLLDGTVNTISVKAENHVGLKIGPALIEQTSWKANEALGYAASVSTKIGNL